MNPQNIEGDIRNLEMLGLETHGNPSATPPCVKVECVEPAEWIAKPTNNPECWTISGSPGGYWGWQAKQICKDVNAALSSLRGDKARLTEALQRIATEDRVSSVQSAPYLNPRDIATDALANPEPFKAGDDQAHKGAIRELVAAYDEYISKLGDEIGDLMGLHRAHGGWNSQRIELGKACRATIDRLKASVLESNEVVAPLIPKESASASGVTGSVSEQSEGK